ncbi:MAG: type I-U CRISPR-associated protein Csb2 [Candidatus Competibacteraceae bacterium]
MWLRVSFPSGRCYAARAEDPALPEWPPHPSRVFSALVAAAYRSGEGMTARRRAALEWFEGLPPPVIAAPAADLAAAPVSYVPPGDSVERKGKKGEEQYEHGIHRWRQPRHFPSAIILGEPVVGYGWAIEAEEPPLAVLADIAAGVTHVGTSHALALVEFDAGPLPMPATLVPDPLGSEFLRIPVSGRLAELDALYQGNAGVRRPAPACEPLAAYRPLTADSARTLPARMELIALRLTGSAHDADRAADLARAVRRAVMAVLGDHAPAAVHGHGAGAHVAWLPLPDVGHPHAGGRIIGLGLGLPVELAAAQRTEILAGIARLDGIHLPDGRTAGLVRPAPAERLPQALLARTWVGPATEWATVTPVVLDRPPKRPDENRLRRALAESLHHAGYPAPVTVDISPFSRFQGAPPAFRISSPERKPRYHAVVSFAEPVAGPVIAGRLRYFGVGLFRPWAERCGGSDG